MGVPNVTMKTPARTGSAEDYVAGLLALVRAKNPNEVEFHQAVHEVVESPSVLLRQKLRRPAEQVDRGGYVSTSVSAMPALAEQLARARPESLRCVVDPAKLLLQPERLLEVIRADVMEERGELLLFPLPCYLPYAFQPL